jgi:hypothetical protein
LYELAGPVARLTNEEPVARLEVVVLKEMVGHLRHLVQDARVDLLGGLGLQHLRGRFADDPQHRLERQQAEQEAEQHQPDKAPGQEYVPTLMF